MADISMCSDKLCPSAYKCHRFTAPISHWQAMQDFKREKDELKCDDFLDNSQRIKRNMEKENE